MYSIHDELKEKIKSLSIDLKERYRSVLQIETLELRDFIEKEIGELKTIEKIDREELELFQKKGGIVGVDGSNNRVGGSEPHFVEAYQALAKSTLKKHQAIFLADIYSPLEENTKTHSILEDVDHGDEKEDKKNIKLATLEVEAAILAAERWKPYAVLMDGGLIRYNIYAKEAWIKLRKFCEDEGILLLGVIEDIKTSIIGDKLKAKYSDFQASIYDRDILFGKLNYGEMIKIKEQVNKKGREGYSSVFLRSSNAPTVIGLDILDSQKPDIEKMARLVLSLTPETSRGIPLWLDIVDKEVKISDEMMKALIETYMDRELYERFFIAERDRRN